MLMRRPHQYRNRRNGIKIGGYSIVDKTSITQKQKAGLKDVWIVSRDAFNRLNFLAKEEKNKNAS